MLPDPVKTTTLHSITRCSSCSKISPVEGALLLFLYRPAIESQRNGPNACHRISELLQNNFLAFRRNFPNMHRICISKKYKYTVPHPALGIALLCCCFCFVFVFFFSESCPFINLSEWHRTGYQAQQCNRPRGHGRWMHGLCFLLWL